MSVQTRVQSSFSSLIRAELRPRYDALDEIPLWRRLVEGTVQRREYVRLLRHLLPLHEAIEERVLCWSDASEWLVRHLTPRCAALLSDLVALGEPTLDFLEPSVGEASSSLAAMSSEELAGALYVFEDFRMRSFVLVRSVAAALGVPSRPGRGLDYHNDGLRFVLPRLRAFRQELDKRYDDGSDGVMRGVRRSMSLLRSIFEQVGEARS